MQADVQMLWWAARQLIVTVGMVRTVKCRAECGTSKQDFNRVGGPRSGDGVSMPTSPWIGAMFNMKEGEKGVV